mgnify:CR=1 FL=1
MHPIYRLSYTRVAWKNGIWVLKNSEAAEFVKLAETTYRDVNIALANQFAVHAEAMDVDIYEVIEASNSQNYSHIHQPGVAVGGHCIPVDPLYLAEAAREAGAPVRFIELADEINLGMPTYFVGRASEMLGGLKDKKVLVIGVSYKPNVADIRETPVEALISGLKKSFRRLNWA